MSDVDWLAAVRVNTVILRALLGSGQLSRILWQVEEVLRADGLYRSAAAVRLQLDELAWMDEADRENRS